MSVYIDSPRGKEKLVAEFSKYGKVETQITSETKLIIPTVDETLPFFAQNKEWFNKQGIEVMVASPFTINHCRDKAEFNLFCVRHGFQTPRTFQFDGYLKPRYGKGSRGITRITTQYIVQMECTFPEISIDYFADLNGNVISIIPRYRLDVQNGESHAMEPVVGMDLTQVKRLGTELGLVGHNVIQGFYSEGVFVVGEVNPRFGGGSWLTFDRFSSPEYLCKYLKKSCTMSQAS